MVVVVVVVVVVGVVVVVVATLVVATAAVVVVIGCGGGGGVRCKVDRTLGIQRDTALSHARDSGMWKDEDVARDSTAEPECTLAIVNLAVCYLSLADANGNGAGPGL